MGKVHRFFKKRSASWVLLLSLSSLLFITACEKTQKHGIEESHGRAAELTISVDAGLVSDDFLNFIADFSETHDVKIQINERPSGKSGENKVMTELLTGNASDILLFNSGGLFKTLDPQEYFYDLSTEYYADQYIDSYRVAVSVGAEIYGLPMGNADAIGFIYRKDIYYELDLKFPEDWSSFESNLEQIKTAGITPILASFKDQWLTQYYWYVAEISGAQDEIEPYQEVFQKLDTLKTKDYFSSNLLTMSLVTGLNDFGNKNSAHLLGQYSFRNYLTSNHLVTEENIGFFPFPNQENQYIYMLPSSLYINKKAADLALCKSFFKEYFEEKIANQISTKEQPGVLKDAKIQPEKIIYEQQMDYKVDIMPELLLDYFTDNLTADEVIHQYEQRNEELKLIY